MTDSSKMIFKEISEKQYYSFWKKSEQRNFLNSPKMAKIHPESKYLYFGVFDSAGGYIKCDNDSNDCSKIWKN